MKNKHKFELKIAAVIGAVMIIAIVAVGYINQLNKTVASNINGTISELAEHDQNSIQTYIEETWKDLEYLEGKFTGYNCDTIEEIEALMNVESGNSNFSHIYMVAEDGKVYTDKFLTYDPESYGQNGRINILQYFENGDERIVSRFDDRVPVAGLTRESIIYGIRLKDFSVSGIRMVGLVGISEIGSIQDRLTIDSFSKDGYSRGHSAVIDMDGNYVVNVEQNVYLNEQDNFLDMISDGLSSELDRDTIVEKMKNNETFNFDYTDSKGVEKITYCMPFGGDNIGWYFLLSVEKVVFTEQNRMFLMMSMIMLGAIVVVVAVLLIYVMHFHKKEMQANAEIKARTIFLANMSHEIRTPLNGIIGLIYLMEKDVDNTCDKETIKRRLSKAEVTAEYLLSLINNILDISKIEAVRLEINNESISPERIIDEIQFMQKSNIEKQKIELTVDKNITVPWIIGDQILIKRVLMNVVGNAVKFTPAGGRIALSVRQVKKNGHHVDTIFTCTDTGCGMSEEFLEHIWDSFSQERNKNENSTKGTGLGMSISKMLMDAMGGEIKGESKLGEGSTFTVILHSEEASEPPATTEEIEENNRRLITYNKTLKILVAEDNELNAEIIAEILKDEGFEVECAENGQVALEKFCASEEGEFDIILMDMQMPVMDGCTAAAEIRKLPRKDAKSVEIFACTANSFKEDRIKALESGMNDFLAKPINISEMLRKIGAGKSFVKEQND